MLWTASAIEADRTMTSGLDFRKRRVALSSLLAAVGLTAFKVAVGTLTGSLGILAEAAHSGLDLAAAAATYFAVRLSAKPPDRGHRYGHGKIENLSALFETLLLLGTCAWIVDAAVRRIWSGGVEIEVTWWSFAVMFFSIAVDRSRSRALDHIAKESNSQALEADALHFQTDIWSSSVVILGLACVKIAGWVPALRWLRYADAVAAMGVAAIAAVLTSRLGSRTVQALLDSAPGNLEERIIAAAEAVPGVIDCHRVRFRYSGPTLFADIHVTMNGSLTLQEAHAITELVEHSIQEMLRGADVTVHAEPPE